jgi:hypothetical protein
MCRFFSDSIFSPKSPSNSLSAICQPTPVLSLNMTITYSVESSPRVVKLLSALVKMRRYESTRLTRGKTRSLLGVLSPVISSVTVVNFTLARDIQWSVIDVDYSADGRFLAYSSWSDFVHMVTSIQRSDSHS